MAGAGKYILGGLLGGLGDSMIKVGAAKREAALRELELQMRAQENEKDRAFRKEEAGADRLLRKGEGDADRKMRLDEGAADRKARLDEGAADRSARAGESAADRAARLKEGEADRALDERRVKLDEEEFGYKKDNGLLSGADDLVEVYDATSPTGTKWVPKAQAAGQPGKTNAKDVMEQNNADLATREVEAEEQATREAKAKGGSSGPWDNSDFPEDGSREAFVARRKKEIMNGDTGKPAADSSGGATPDVKGSSADQPEQKTGDGAPKGAGTRADPYKAVSQTEIDWFKKSAPKGSVIMINGQLYTK